MGAFVEIMEKVRQKDIEARASEKLALMRRNGVTISDLKEGRWEIRERNSELGRFTLQLYRLEESVTVNIEGQVRLSVAVTPAKPQEPDQEGAE